MYRVLKITKVSTYGTAPDVGLLVLRMGLGLLMMGHGWSKMMGFSEKAADFYDLFGLGGEISLGLTVFAEFFCSILLVVGLGTRLVLIPLLIVTMVIVFDVKGDIPFAERELPLLYLVGYLSLLLTGPGRFAIDYYIWRK